jgi:hypothetical protein
VQQRRGKGHVRHFGPLDMSRVGAAHVRGIASILGNTPRAMFRTVSYTGGREALYAA